MIIRTVLGLVVAFSTVSPSPLTSYLGGSDMIGSSVSSADVSTLGLNNVSALSKRWDGSPAMGQEYAKAKNKGCTLWSMMHMDDTKAGELFTPPRALAHSDHLQLDDLTKWAYVTKTPKKDPKCDMGNDKDMYGLQALLNARGLSADKKDWDCVRITHGDPEHKTVDIDSQTYSHPDTGTTLRVTGALFHFGINAKDGVLIVTKRYSPAHQAKYRRPPVDPQEFPGLRSSSDIAWLAWKPYHEKGFILKHVVIWTVSNGASQRLIAAALESMPFQDSPDVDKVLKPYPWIGFQTDTRPGSLVLGSPNGIGIGFLLVQHKPELGNRRVKKIEIFLADTAASGLREPSLIMDIEDAPIK